MLVACTARRPMAYRDAGNADRLRRPVRSARRRDAGRPVSADPFSGGIHRLAGGGGRSAHRAPTGADAGPPVGGRGSSLSAAGIRPLAADGFRRDLSLLLRPLATAAFSADHRCAPSALAAGGILSWTTAWRSS